MAADKSSKDKKTAPTTDYVVYVVATVSIKCRCRTSEEAAKFAGGEVSRLLSGADRNVYIPKVAVVEADDDEEQKRNIAEEVAPWLVEGEEGKKPS